MSTADACDGRGLYTDRTSELRRCHTADPKAKPLPERRTALQGTVAHRVTVSLRPLANDVATTVLKVCHECRDHCLLMLTVLHPPCENTDTAITTEATTATTTTDKVGNNTLDDLRNQSLVVEASLSRAYQRITELEGALSSARKKLGTSADRRSAPSLLAFRGLMRGAAATNGTATHTDPHGNAGTVLDHLSNVAVALSDRVARHQQLLTATVAEMQYVAQCRAMLERDPELQLRSAVRILRLDASQRDAARRYHHGKRPPTGRTDGGDDDEVGSRGEDTDEEGRRDGDDGPSDHDSIDEEKPKHNGSFGAAPPQRVSSSSRNKLSHRGDEWVVAWRAVPLADRLALSLAVPALRSDAAAQAGMARVMQLLDDAARRPPSFASAATEPSSSPSLAAATNAIGATRSSAARPAPTTEQPPVEARRDVATRGVSRQLPQPPHHGDRQRDNGGGSDARGFPADVLTPEEAAFVSFQRSALATDVQSAVASDAIRVEQIVRELSSTTSAIMENLALQAEQLLEIDQNTATAETFVSKGNDEARKFMGDFWTPDRVFSVAVLLVSMLLIVFHSIVR